MPNKTSNHILSTSTNLLGLCLIVITSLHITDKNESNLLDELTSVVALLLAFSSLLSFASIRTEKTKKEYRLEQIADYFFIASLIGVFGIIIFIVFNFY